jgi:hypothetical protein
MSPSSSVTPVGLAEGEVEGYSLGCWVGWDWRHVL